MRDTNECDLMPSTVAASNPDEHEERIRFARRIVEILREGGFDADFPPDATSH